MPKEKPVCETVLPWLRANLGKNCLGPMTGTDVKALAAAVQILHLYAYDASEVTLEAFRIVVERMQPSTQELAYHAIAHVMDWQDRARLWFKAGLEAIHRPRVCAYEPGGSTRREEVPA